MKALRLRADREGRSADASVAWDSPQVRLEEISAPVPRADELLIRVRYCGLCGSDYHLASGAYPGLASLPVTIGHEFSGVVAGHGAGTSPGVVAAFPVGTPVTAEEMQWCGSCGACRAGHVNHCENLEELGFTVDGAHSEFVRVPAKYCWSLAGLCDRVGEENSFRLGAMVEPYSVSFRALFQGAHAGAWIPGQRVLVLGAGPIGLAACDLALAAGALDVACVEVDSARRDLAARIGVSPSVGLDGLAALSGQYDWILDAAGAPPLLMNLAQNHLAVGGTVCLLARTAEALPLLPELLITRNARVVGSQGHSGEGTFGRVIALMGSKRLRALDLVEKVVTLEEAAERLTAQEKCGGKIFVRPS
ncbi:MAG: alcohol dehydrogenase catalytic domain-containing protein [Bdellovibrionota bacterium]